MNYYVNILYLGEGTHEVHDHLGIDGSNAEAGLTLKEQSSYYPFGMQIASLSYSREDYTFGMQGMIRDDEMKGAGNVMDFGARLFGSREGRFFSVDPLASKYPSISGYAAMNNNPIFFVDPDGREVRAHDLESKQLIVDMLKSTDAAYIEFDAEGFINRERINQNSSESVNFNQIKEMVNANLITNVRTVNSFDYLTKKGEQSTAKMSPVRIEDRKYGSYYMPSTNEYGFTGYTQTPLLLTDIDQASEDFYSLDNQIYVNINKSLSRKGKAETGAHEMLGHGYFYYLFKDKNVNVNPSHIIMSTSDGSTEGNIQLMMQILGRMGETQMNYEINNSEEK